MSSVGCGDAKGNHHRALRKTLLAVTLLLLVVPTRSASGHATLLSSSPASGSVVTASPSQIRLLFSEPIVGSMSRITLISANGDSISLKVAGDPGEVRALLATPPVLSPTSYRVAWHTVSADGHPLNGSFGFAIGGAVAPAQPVAVERHETEASGVALIPAFLRGLALSALLAACGLLGFAAYTPGSERQVTIASWLSAAATVFFAAHLIAWLVHVSPTSTFDSSEVRAALSRQVGLTELLRLILTALSMWALLLAKRAKLAFAFALAAVLIGGAIGHSAAVSSAISVPAKALHLAGAAFWLGGLIWLVSDRSDKAVTVRAAAAVSSVAVLAITTVALTGIVQSFLFLSAWTDLFATPYGIALTGKVAGLLALAGFGAYHRYVILPRIAASGVASLQRSVRREIALMILVVILGGLLAYLPIPST